MIPKDDRVLLQVWWTDCTNVAGGWHDAEDLDHFAANGAWEASNTGWLVWEDEKCYVLAGRITDDGRNVGLIERIPKGAVTGKVVLSGPRADGSDEGGGIVTTITVSQAQPGDVLLDSAQTEWKRGPDFRTWSTFGGLVVYEGPWDESYGPAGDLTLLVRDGKPVITA